MAKPTGFLEYGRRGASYRDASERVKDFKQVQEDFSKDDIERQAARCMDCGVPFCIDGCPLGNVIPDWNELM